MSEVEETGNGFNFGPLVSMLRLYFVTLFYDLVKFVFFFNYSDTLLDKEEVDPNTNIFELFVVECR